MYNQRKSSLEATQELFKFVDNQLTPQQTQQLETPLTLEELTTAINNLPSNKAPGPDGLVNKFWKKCSYLAQGILEMWNHSLNEGKLSPLTRLGILSLLNKKPPVNQLTNYRPLTLTNTDYKIIATVLSQWLKKVVQKVVGIEQSGFIPKRDIRGSIIEAQLALEYNIHWRRDTGIALLDFEKAYDRVDQEYLFKVFQQLGFGPNYIQSISTLHEESNIIIRVNSHYIERIPVQSGVKQGCPWAPLGYAVARASSSSNMQ